MKFIKTENLNTRQKNQIFTLWNQEYPEKLLLSNVAAFEEYLQNIDDKHHILLCDKHGTIKGWLIYFMRDGERCFAMIIDPSVQGKGWGSKFLDEAKKCNSELNGWVVDHSSELKQNGEKYVSPIGFYKKNGFQVLSDIVTTKEGINGIKVIWKK
ncbi:MAG: GNAT family N-acetyltransferase [Balneolaceae bacterium]|nr:GNAT family N-acetyltransferase [Balneolaceae bacterium]